MPYDIREIDGEYCVVKRDDEKRMGCHETRAGAVSQLAAIEASESDKNMNQLNEKRFALVSQQESNFAGISSELSDGVACKNCRFYRGADKLSACLIVANWPEQIESISWCERFERAPEYSASVEVDIEENVKNEGLTMKSRIENIFSRFRGALKSETLDLSKGAFKALGNGLWIAAYTNNFLDRDNEILTRKALLGYVDRVQRGFVDMPELWYWHTPGTKHGKAFWVDYETEGEGKPISVIALGEFDRTPAGREAEKHYLESPPGAYKLSHGFNYPDYAKKVDKNGIGYYEVINTFEVTTIPAESNAESNPYTFFAVESSSEGIDMKLTDEMRKDIASRYGDEMLKQVDAFSETVAKSNKAAESENVAYKDFVDTLGDRGETETETKGTDEETASGDESASFLETQLLSELYQDVGELAQAQTQTSERLQAIFNRFEGLETTLNEARVEFDKAVKSFDSTVKSMNSFLSQTPKGVDETDNNTIPEGEAQSAQKNLDRRKGDEGGAKDKSFWGWKPTEQNANGGS